VSTSPTLTATFWSSLPNLTVDEEAVGR